MSQVNYQILSDFIEKTKKTDFFCQLSFLCSCDRDCRGAQRPPQRSEEAETPKSPVFQGFALKKSPKKNMNLV